MYQRLVCVMFLISSFYCKVCVCILRWGMSFWTHTNNNTNNFNCSQEVLVSFPNRPQRSHVLWAHERVFCRGCVCVQRCTCHVCWNTDRCCVHTLIGRVKTTLSISISGLRFVAFSSRFIPKQTNSLTEVIDRTQLKLIWYFRMDTQSHIWPNDAIFVDICRIIIFPI